MLGKMLIHGLVAAALIGSAAAVYAQAKDTGYLSPAGAPGPTSDKVGTSGKKEAGNDGYIHPAAGTDTHRRGGEGEREGGRHHDRRHDDDDD